MKGSALSLCALTAITGSVYAAGDRALPVVVTQDAAVLAHCPGPAPLTPEQASAQRLIEAHQLIEREGGQAYAQDPALQGRVVAVLLADRRLARSAITVETRRHNVELTGCVRSPAQKKRAEARVKGVPGVRDVWNRLELTR
jgi:hypothetical protein